MVIKRNDHAVSEVLSTSLSIVIVIGTVTSLLYWGTPYIDGMKAQSIREDASSKLSVAVDNIYDITHETPGSRRTSSMDVSGGIFQIDNTSSDRFVMSYALEPGYSFNVSNLDDNDKNFNITMAKGTLSYVDVDWFDDDPVMIFDASKEFSVLYPHGRVSSAFLFDVSSLYSDVKVDHLTSVKLRLIPVNGVDVVANQMIPVSLSSLSEGSWSRTFSNSFLQPFSVPRDTLQALMVSYPGYVESTDLLSLFEKEYGSHHQFFSLLLGMESFGDVFSGVQLDLNLISVDNVFVSSAFHEQNAAFYRPQLIVSYVSNTQPQGSSASLDGDTTTQISYPTEDGSPGITMDDSLLETGSVHVYRSCLSSDDGPVRLVPERQMVHDVSYDFQVEGALYSALFQAQSSQSSQHPIVVTSGGYAVWCTPGDYLSYVADDSSLSEFSAVEKQASTAQVTGAVLTYAGQYGPGIDLRYTAGSDTVKEELVVDRCQLLPLPPSDGMDLALVHHLEAFSLETGEAMGVRYGDNQTVLYPFDSPGSFDISGFEPFYFTDADDQVVFTLPCLYAWDSASPMDRIPLERTVRCDAGGGISVFIRTPWSWLADTNRVYPVFIDDTFTIYNASGNFKAIHGTKPFPPTSGLPATPVLYTSTEINKIKSDDIIYNGWSSPGLMPSNKHTALQYTFHLSESIDDIKKIKITWNGYCDQDWYIPPCAGACDDIYLYIQNGGSWEGIASSSKTSSDINLMKSLYSNFGFYVDSITNNVTLLLVGDKTTGTSSHHTYEDYVELKVYAKNPPQVTDEIPYNGAPNQNIRPTFYVTVTDNDNDPLLVTFYLNFSGTSFQPIGTPVSCSSGQQASVVLDTALPLDLDKIYSWYVTVQDDVHTVTSPTWTFTTHGAIFFRVDSPQPRAQYHTTTVQCRWVNGDESYPLQYRYQVNGYINQWSQWTTQEAATFFNLPFGDYTFLIQAKSTDPDQPTVFPDGIPFSVVGNIKHSQKNLLVSAEGGFSCAYPLQGTVKIDLYYTPSTGSNVLFGRIYLFDLGQVKHTYNSMTGTYVTVMENDALIAGPAGSEKMKRPYGAEVSNENLTLRIVQIRPSDGYYQGGSGNLRFTCVLMENLIHQMRSDVSELKIQVYGPYFTTWLDYLHSKGFEYGSGMHTVQYPIPSASTLKLILLHSLCKVGFR